MSEQLNNSTRSELIATLEQEGYAEGYARLIRYIEADTNSEFSNHYIEANPEANLKEIFFRRVVLNVEIDEIAEEFGVNPVLVHKFYEEKVKEVLMPVTSIIHPFRPEY
jgi:hypothetical protein